MPRDYSEDDWKGVKNLGQKEMAFLLQFAVCDLEATLEAQDAVFGPIAEWLLDSILSDKEARRAMADRFERGYGRARFCLSRKEDDGDSEQSWGPCPVSHLPDGRGSHSDAHLVVWELMQMFWLVEEVRPYGLQGSMLDRRAPRAPSTPDGGANEDNRKPLESAVAIFFGMFRAEETLLPTSDSPRPRLITYPAVPETNEQDHGDGKLPRSMSVAVFFDCLFHHSGRPNRIDDRTPVAPLDVKFFEYFLQRHLGLCLDSQAFREDEDEWMDRSFQEFNGTLAIFAHDDVEDRGPYSDWSGDLERAGFSDGSEMLTKYPPDFTRFPTASFSSAP